MQSTVKIQDSTSMGGVAMPPEQSKRELTRRDFLAGALATGTLSAVGTYLTPGGSTPSSVNIKFVTGVDSSGARDVLVSMWNRANPRATVVVEEVGGESTLDQRNAMESKVTSGTPISSIWISFTFRIFATSSTSSPFSWKTSSSSCPAHCSRVAIPLLVRNTGQRHSTLMWACYSSD